MANKEEQRLGPDRLPRICTVENYNSRPMTGNTANDENRVYDLGHGELENASDAYLAQVT